MAVFYLIMEQDTTINPSRAAEHLGDADWAFVDCRFSLSDTGRGERDYREEHVAGAVYAHLDRDLSGPVVPGVTGRHPLPSHESLVRTFSRLGISSRTRVVAYDDANGSIAAPALVAAEMGRARCGCRPGRRVCRVAFRRPAARNRLREQAGSEVRGELSSRDDHIRG